MVRSWNLVGYAKGAGKCKSAAFRDFPFSLKKREDSVLVDEECWWVMGDDPLTKDERSNSRVKEYMLRSIFELLG